VRTPQLKEDEDGDDDADDDDDEGDETDDAIEADKESCGKFHHIVLLISCVCYYL